VSYAQRLRQSPPHELEREYALFSVGLPLTGISPTRFHEALSRAAIAVTIVETDGPSERAGVTCSAISTVCDTPPPILFCVNRVSAVNSVIKASAVPSVSRLTAARLDISGLFSGTDQVSMSERVASNRWQYSSTGTPYFNARAARVAGRRASLPMSGCGRLFRTTSASMRGSNANRSRTLHAPHHSGTARLKADIHLPLHA
jgi:hypothetical protein